jgi:HSP20 family protein
MAEAGTKRQQSSEERSRASQQSGSGTSMERRRGGQEERGGWLTRSGIGSSFFSVSPGEFFTLSPISLMRRLTEDIDRAIGFGGMSRRGAAEHEFDWIPPVELCQEGKNLVARLDLPGLSEKDVHVEVSEDGLSVTGERRQESSTEERGARRSEISYGRFYRLIPLPEGAETDNAKATFRNGVLEVTIPVTAQQPMRKSIPVSASGEGSSSSEGRSRTASSSSS